MAKDTVDAVEFVLAVVVPDGSEFVVKVGDTEIFRTTSEEIAIDTALAHNEAGA